MLHLPSRSRCPIATSHAPTIGRKRRYSVTERDVDHAASSTAKRMKNDLVQDTECDSASEEKNTNGDTVLPVEGQDVKEVTKGVKDVDLEDKDKAEESTSIRPEGVPLPDSPSGSPEPEPESPELAKSGVVEETKDEEHANDDDSVPSSESPEEDVEEDAVDSGRTEAESVTTNTSVDGIEPAKEVITAAVESGLHEPLAVEVKA